MQSESAQAVLFVLGMVVAAVGFIALVFGVNRVVSPRNPNAEKTDPYECGMPAAGKAHARNRMRFSTIALLFVLFDAEAVLLFAVATLVRGSFAGLVEVALFTGLLAAGLGYAWRKGALSWPI